MGIQGLTTFIARNADRSLEDFYLNNQCLVIDGNSLAVQLYQNSTRCNSAFGGDYDLYAHTIQKFFNALTKCKITPYVIFDGGYEDKKMNTVLKRFKCRIVDASQMNPRNQSKYLVFPLMMKDVFVQTLASSNIPFTVCEYEADHEIAAVARYLKCPVLSYDSDFFVYNVKYIPFPSVTLKPSLLKTEEGVKYVLKCKLYKVENFLKLFPGVDDNVLPLIATLLGNDYVKRSVFHKFYENLRQPKSKRLNVGQCRIVGVIEWLKNESFDSAVEKVLSHFKLCERSRIENLIIKSCSNYTRTYCGSLQELGISHSPDSTPDCEQSVIQDIAIPTCPAWILDILKKGLISPRYFDLVHKSFYIANPQAEDFTKSDSILASLSIIRFIFDIFTNFDKRTMILECRRGVNQKSKNINYLEYLSDDVIKNIFHINQCPEQQLFILFLEKNISTDLLMEIKKVPDDLQMPIIAILWMMKSSDENITIPNEFQVYSLLLCFLSMFLIRAKVGSSYTQFEFNAKFASDIKLWSEQFKQREVSIVPGLNGLDENNVCYEDCIIAESKMLKYFEIDSKVLEFPKAFKSQYLHIFAQFQCCLQQLSYLNIITGKLYSPCCISKLYNGTFIYNMYANLKRRDNPGAYIHQLLVCCPTVLNYFTILVSLLGLKVYSPLEIQTKPKAQRKTKKIVENIVSDEPIQSNDHMSDEDGELEDFNNRFNALKFA